MHTEVLEAVVGGGNEGLAHRILLPTDEKPSIGNIASRSSWFWLEHESFLAFVVRVHGSILEESLVCRLLLEKKSPVCVLPLPIQECWQVLLFLRIRFLLLILS